MVSALSRRCGLDGAYSTWEPAAREAVVRLHIDGLALQPPQREPLPGLRCECRLLLCRLTAHLRHAIWVSEARRHYGPGLGFRCVMHRVASEETGVWTALMGGEPPERRDLRRRRVKHVRDGERRERGQHAAPTAYASLRQLRPWKVRKRQPSTASAARSRQGFGGHAASSQQPMR